MTSRRWRLAALTAIVATLPAFPQYVEEDDTTRDHALRDKLYLERLKRAQQDERATMDAEERRKATHELAEKLIRDSHYDVAASERFVVRTDDPGVSATKTLQLLEEFADFYDTVWGDAVERRELPGKTPVYLFYSYADYNKILPGDFARNLLRPKGHYAGDIGMVALHTDSDSKDQLPDLLLHELAHLLNDHVLGIGPGKPTWVVEGLASVFEYVWRDADGVFHATDVGGKNLVIHRGASAGRNSEGAQTLRQFKRAVRLASIRKQSVVESIVSRAWPDSFYGGDAQDVAFSYGGSWLLMHFLLYGEDGALRAGTLDFILRGHEAGETLFDTLDVDSEDLEARFAAHLKEIDTH